MAINTCALLGKRDSNHAAPSAISDASDSKSPPFPGPQTCGLTSRGDADRLSALKRARAVRKLLDDATRYFGLWP